jgi:hypothetical protein
VVCWACSSAPTGELTALACLGAPVQAQDTDKTKPATGQHRVITPDAPKGSSVIDRFDLKTTDSGSNVRQRLEVDILKDKDTFIFGDKTTMYPTARNPGQEFQPAIPQTSPKDTYSIGIGRRF